MTVNWFNSFANGDKLPCRILEYMVGMIGSVGGTLGMCIGFSFSGLTKYILNVMENRLTKK